MARYQRYFVAYLSLPDGDAWVQMPWERDPETVRPEDLDDPAQLLTVIPDALAEAQLCRITGQPTPLPKRGTRGMYLHIADDVNVRMGQLRTGIDELRRKVRFTGPAKRRWSGFYKELLGIMNGDDEDVGKGEKKARKLDKRPRVAVELPVAQAIDAMPGRHRTAKTNLLLVEALAERERIAEGRPRRPEGMTMLDVFEMLDDLSSDDQRRVASYLGEKADQQEGLR